MKGWFYGIFNFFYSIYSNGSDSDCYYDTLYSRNTKKEQEKQRKELEKYATFYEYDHSLVLHQRSPELAKYIKIKERIKYDISYEPEKLHIGSVTVGGVTTGGTYKTGGYNYISGEHKTGLYRLEYFDNTIWKIKFDDAMYQEVIQSPIKQYLDENKEIYVTETYDKCQEIKDWITLVTQ